MNIYVLAVCAGLVLLTAGSAFAGAQELPYKCEVNVKPEEITDRCIGCKTEQMCAKEEEALRALRETNTIIAYTLVGDSLQLPPHDPSAEKIHRYEIIAHKVIEDQLAKDIAEVFVSSIVNQISLGACFEPRHALTIKTDNHTYDYLLCFECALALYRDGQHISTLGTHRDYSVLNALVLKAGLPLSPYYAEQAEEKE